MSINNVKELVQKNKFTKKTYLELKNLKHKSDFRINNIRKIVPIKSDNKDIRINIILPVLNRSKVYGGITTALKFFFNLSNLCNAQTRIIITGNEKYNQKFTYIPNGFSHNSENKGIFFVNENNKIDIRENDYFIVTFWETAYIFFDVFQWQCKYYNLNNRKFIYFIQDYEPGFYAWSAEYILAESTYKSYNKSVIAVFNSQELKCFFENNNYKFYKEYAFSPVINDELKKIILSQKEKKQRKKKIIIYGRPNSKRNAYEMVRYSLEQWSRTYKQSGEWEIIALGDNFKNVKLKNNAIIFKGKLSIAEYAEEMMNTFIGISLMVSPHPSYVPLELATFGVKTITNSYANKDLSYFSDNIISLDVCTPDNIVKELIKLCDLFDKVESSFSFNEKYFSENEIDNLIVNVKDELFK